MVEFLVFLYNKNERDSMKEKEEYEVVVEKQDHFGRGIAKIDGFLVFVDGALPNEVVRIQITKMRKKFANAKVIEILRSSKERISPICPYSGQCGGCQLLMQDASNQLDFKKGKVREILERYGKISSLTIQSVFQGKTIQYRNKVIFHGNHGRIGFYYEKTNSLVEVSDCMLIDEKLKDLYYEILLKKQPDDFIDRLMLRITSKKEIMVALDGHVSFLSPLLDLFHHFPVHSVFINNQLVFGQEYITEEVFGFKFQVRKNAFFQINYEMMQALYQIVIQYYKKKEYTSVLDLYCGTGTIGILLSPYVKHVTGIEVVEDAVCSANQNKEINHVSNISFFKGKVENLISKFQNVNSVVVDPPRSGLDQVTISSILDIGPQSITYISCDPVTLARDLSNLSQDYRVIEIHLVDMFPNTYHIETVVILEKK